MILKQPPILNYVANTSENAIIQSSGDANVRSKAPWLKTV